jgi:hypothetical protein
MNSWDPANPFTGVSGIPVNMTGFAQRMAEAGYKHRTFAGKADFGMAYEKSTPIGRGYSDALFYFNHMNDYYSLNVGTCLDPVSNSSVFNRDLFAQSTSANGTRLENTHTPIPPRQTPACKMRLTAALCVDTASSSTGPQYHLLNPKHCWVQNMTGAEDPVAPYPKSMDGCEYEEEIFTQFTIEHITKHDSSTE